jgi:OOP family OmpA-OmpF porin
MMRAVLGPIALFVLAVSQPAPAAGRPRLTLDAFGGAAFFDSQSVPELGDVGYYGGRAGLRVHPWIGLEGTYGVIDPADGRVNHLGLDALFHPWSLGRFHPYLLGGWTQLEFDLNASQTQTLNGWELGLGAFVRLAGPVSLRADVRDVRLDQDAPPAWLDDVLVSGGVSCAFGGQERDADRDGVPDRLDRCAETPAGVAVDAEGCPLDSDQDGVPDASDACPATPRGVRVGERGCPLDADADGVADGLDQCPETAAGVAVDPRGCPLDSDADGVPDAADRCPGTPAGTRVGADGCPLAAREVELLDTGLLRLQDVRFEKNRATLLDESRPALDEVGAILEKWPQLRIEIGGHTDDTGEADYNRGLSEKRAQAVLDYLREKFPRIDASQYSLRGYGEDAPIADNKTRDGRAQNRRVEFKVQNHEVLRRETER